MDRTFYLASEEPAHLRTSHIPTLGAPTTAIDQYRVVAIASSNLSELRGAFADVEAAAALAKIAEGGISSVTDLEAAETALQAVLLHDIVHIVTAGPKIVNGGFCGYWRQDQDARSPLSY
ncbi:MAG TPA: hypothetical protein VIL72_06880, partial [Beijerinckiaceae bacterium]